MRTEDYERPRTCRMADRISPLFRHSKRTGLDSTRRAQLLVIYIHVYICRFGLDNVFMTEMPQQQEALRFGPSVRGTAAAAVVLTEVSPDVV